MPNAKEPEGVALHNILLIGQPGTGKTSQFWTLPRPGFLYVFDPNCIASLTGLDMEYEIFSPDLLDINVHPLSASKRSDSVMKADEPTAYTRWEEHFENALETDYFKQFKWIGMDSFTTFSDSVMDRVQFLNNRLGKQPEQADWASQMFTIQNVMRSLSARQMLFVATAHDEHRQDPTGGHVTYQPVMTGRLRTRIPLLFSNILRTDVEASRAGNTYLLHTGSDRLHQYVRVSKSIANVLKDPTDGGTITELDVTIKDFDRAEEFGLGSLLRKAGMLQEETPSQSSGKTRKGDVQLPAPSKAGPGKKRK